MDIVTSQADCDEAFRFWAETMTCGGKPVEGGWLIEGRGVLFTNYGRGDPGKIEDQIMLGVDPDTWDSTVKIVRPNVATLDKGKVTVLATDDNGHKVLLREGRLKQNNVSAEIKDDFPALSGLTDVPLMVKGERSSRRWYVVADLDADPATIIAQTASFSLGCTRARLRRGGGLRKPEDAELDDDRPTYGMDEKGNVTTRKRTGGDVQVRALQGYVFEALKKIVGEILKKPKANGYCVDGHIASANLLIEIKTGASAHCIYEAIGQLELYPRLIHFVVNSDRALLIPDTRPLRPAMTAALASARIPVYTYSIEEAGKKPRISFSSEFIKRCSPAILSAGDRSTNGGFRDHRAAG
jgi:hypothetical protein